MESIARDFRYAVRSLLHARGPTLGALVILALGTGLNTTLFSVVDAALLRPLPYPDADRLMLVSEKHPERGRLVVTPGNFADLRSAHNLFDEATASFPWEMHLAGDGEPERVRARLALDGYFSMLGVPALVGRTFEPPDYVGVHSLSESWRAGDVVVLSQGLWKRRFGSEPAITGQTVRLDGKPFTIIGVMPAEFETIWVGVDLWLPWVLSDEEWGDRRRHELPVMARLRHGVSREQAQAELSAMYARLEQQYPEMIGWRAELHPLRDFLVGEARYGMLFLLGSAGVVLLIASTNVASLMLARAVGRQREIAISQALGATAGAVFRRLLVESLLLFGSGGLLGILVAASTLRVASGVPLPTDFPFAPDPRLDLRVLVAALAISLITGILFGLTPAFQACRVDPVRSLRELGGFLTRTHGSRARSVLVVAQVALASALLVVGALMVESLQQMRNVDLGFDPKGLLTLQIALPGTRYPLEAQQRQFHRQLLELYQVNVSQPLTYLGVGSLLVMVTLLACYIPARRAARIDPWLALQHE